MRIWDIGAGHCQVKTSRWYTSEGLCVRVAQQQFHREGALLQIRIGATSAATHKAVTALTANMRTIDVNVEPKQRQCGVGGAGRS